MNGPTDAVIALVPLLLLIWLVYDVWVSWFWRTKPAPPTITRRIQALSRDYPAIPFLAGIIGGLLAGHFWGQF